MTLFIGFFLENGENLRSQFLIASFYSGESIVGFHSAQNSLKGHIESLGGSNLARGPYV